MMIYSLHMFIEIFHFNGPFIPYYINLIEFYLSYEFLVHLGNVNKMQNNLVELNLEKKGQNMN